MYTKGQVIDNRYYVIDDNIGRGGMGQVLMVMDATNGGQFALKHCHHAINDELRKRFSREIRAMASISHKNVMSVVAQNDSHNPPYFIMPMAKLSLHDELYNGLNLPTDSILKIFLEICYGVQAIHNTDKGYIHRDLKPANVLQMMDGTIVVSDLGLVKPNERNSTGTQIGAGFGTHFYSAPEQILEGYARDVDARADVYSLGKILFQLLSGKLTYILDLRSFPVRLKEIVETAIKDPRDLRYQSVDELIMAVQAYIESQDPQNIANVEKRNLIQQLSFSRSFAMTHSLIAQLEKYPDFSLDEIKKILAAAVANNQFGGIITDSDIFGFLYRVAIPEKENILDFDQQQILNKIISESDRLAIFGDD